MISLTMYLIHSNSVWTESTCSSSVFPMKNERNEFLVAYSICCGICGFEEDRWWKWRRQVKESLERGSRMLMMSLDVTDLNDSPMLDSYLLSSEAKGCSTSTVREARAETVSVSSCNWVPAKAQPLGTVTILTDFQYLPRKKMHHTLIAF